MEEEVKKHLMNLYFLALSDGHFAPQELETIFDIAQERGFSKEDFQEIIINPPVGMFSVPENFLEKISLLYDFARVILADEVVEEEEEATFLKFCERFGFEAEISKELFNWLIDLGRKKLSLEQVQQKISDLITN